MEFSLDSYRMLARMAGIAHREKDVATAKNAFTLLWQRLDREYLQDHCDARETFNREFARAYRSGDNPPCAPAPQPDRSLGAGLNSRKQWAAPAPRAAGDSMARVTKSVALDCAAFFAKQGV